MGVFVGGGGGGRLTWTLILRDGVYNFFFLPPPLEQVFFNFGRLAALTYNTQTLFITPKTYGCSSALGKG